ncbi:MAG: fermentation/respiration switch protein [Chloroflexi bacterium ADurb.Bin325]|nr:MAG: fermentation/respiration switch protein [Chloroflexi bacterium ADurb.Bin325]
MKLKATPLVLLIAMSLIAAACVPLPAGGPAPVAIAAGERTVDVGNGIVGVFNQPAGAAPVPAVLMLHGFGSSKDEVGNMYKNLAAALQERGVASLRIDFRGYGKSDGDTGESSLDTMVADAQTAYEYLKAQPSVDAARIGVLGFSLGGGVAIISAGQHPGWYKSMALWSSVGDPATDMVGSVGQEAFDTAAAKGVVGLDLGFRTIVLKKDFFDSLARYDLAALIRDYPGALLAIAGDQDFSAAYVEGFVAAATGQPKEAWIIPGGDHIYGVLSEDQTMADSVIEKTADWFAQTL